MSVFPGSTQRPSDQPPPKSWTIPPVPVYPPYNPADSNVVEKATGSGVSKFWLVTPSVAAAFVALIQPLYSVALTAVEDPGEAGNPYLYPDNEDRRVMAFMSARDGGAAVQAQLIGPFLQKMFQQYGVGSPGRFEILSPHEVGGRNPGKVFPPKLTWIHGDPDTAPAVISSVSLTGLQAAQLAGDAA